MKKTFLTLAVTVAALLSVTLQSCDDDNYIGMTLQGTWRGNLGIYSMYGDYRYTAAYSEVQFTSDPFQVTSGYGYWIDFYDATPWGNDYIANHIQWNVVSGIIYIHFLEEGTSLMISQYSLDDNYFTGIIRYSTDGPMSQGVHFSMVHVDSPNWNSFDYGYPSYPYYSKPNRMLDCDSTEVESKPQR